MYILTFFLEKFKGVLGISLKIATMLKKHALILCKFSPRRERVRSAKKRAPKSRENAFPAFPNLSSEYRNMTFRSQLFLRLSGNSRGIAAGSKCAGKCARTARVLKPCRDPAVEHGFFLGGFLSLHQL